MLLQVLMAFSHIEQKYIVCDMGLWLGACIGSVLTLCTPQICGVLCRGIARETAKNFPVLCQGFGKRGADRSGNGANRKRAPMQKGGSPQFCGDVGERACRMCEPPKRGGNQRTQIYSRMENECGGGDY